MGETANLRCSAEFAQYQRNAFKCPVLLSSLWALINTCKLAYLPALSYGERGGITVRQRQSSGQSVLNLRFAHQWACHLCLTAGAGWGWDKGRTAGWQDEDFVKSGHVAATESVGKERADQIPVMSWYEPETFVICHPPPFTYFLLLFKKGGNHIEKYKIMQKNLSENKKLQISLNEVTPLQFSHKTTTDMKGHILSTNNTYMAGTQGRPQGPLCLMLAPCCLDKAGWLDYDCGDKKSESD